MVFIPPFGTPPANITNLLPSQTSHANQFLQTDGLGALSWAAPAGAGDMTKAVYDAANVAEQLLGLTAAQSPTNKTFDSTNRFTQTGLVIKGSSANALTIKPNETLSAGRILNLIVNDVDRTINLSGNLTVSSAATISGTNTGDQTITLTGNVTGSGTGSFATTIQSSVPLAGSPTTTTQASTDNSTKIATTAYVTTGIANAIAGVNPAVAVQAATTAASDTSGLTYNNGVSGIGATLTGSNNTAITIDGYTFTALGQRLLVKNDTQSPSGAFNGVYYVTQIQTSILPPILTRALDYDMPSDINNTGAIPVVNGTVNALTSWLLTSSVTTVGTDPLTYTKFSRSPTSVLTPDLGGTGIANNAASTLTISGSFGTTLTVSGTTSLTLPTSGTVTAQGNTVTGSGSIVLATSPSLTTPTLGAATATTINKVTITAPATAATLTIANNKILTIDNTLEFAGTDSTVMTFPSTSDTVAGLAATQTVTNKILSDEFMGDVWDSQSALKESVVLTSSTDFLAIQGIDLSGSNGLEIPATSSLEISSFYDPSSTIPTKQLYNYIKFSVYRNAALSTASATATALPFDTKNFDTTNNVDIVTNLGRFTAPLAGFYFFEGAINLTGNTSLRTIASIYKNGAEVRRGNDPNLASGNIYGSMAVAFLQLVKGDYVEFWYYTASAQVVQTGQLTSFSGFLISQT